jgi:hypothetical protein
MAAAAASTPAATIPAPYLGEWTTDQSVACGDEDTNGVRIDPHNIAFYEAGGAVRSVSEGSKGASATIDFTGEGRKWTEAVRLRPLPGKRLELTALGQTYIYQRCREANPQ